MPYPGTSLIVRLELHLRVPCHHHHHVRIKHHAHIDTIPMFAFPFSSATITCSSLPRLLTSAPVTMLSSYNHTVSARSGKRSGNNHVRRSVWAVASTRCWCASIVQPGNSETVSGVLLSEVTITLTSTPSTAAPTAASSEAPSLIASKENGTRVSYLRNLSL